MKARGLALQGALAGGALVLAFLSWQRPMNAGAADQATVLDLSRGELKSVRYSEGERSWTMERDPKSSDRIWIREVTRTPKPAPAAMPATPVSAPDGGTAPPASAPNGGAVGEMVSTERRVRGADKALEVLARFAPFKAVRSLGVLAPEKLKEIGFETSTRKLEIEAGGAKHAFTLARVPDLGSAYLKKEQDGQVYLLAADLMADLENSSSRLIDRRTHAFKPGEFDGLRIQAGGKERELVVIPNPGGSPTSVKLGSKSAPDRPDELAKNWHDRVWRLAVTEVLGEGEVPPSGEPKSALRIDYLDHGRSKGYLELAKGAGPEVFAKTENSAGWLRISGAVDDLIKEAPRVISGSGS